MPVSVIFVWWITHPKNYFRIILRVLIVLLLFSLMAGLKFKLPAPNRCRIYLVDNSGSIFLNQMALLDAIRKDIQTLRPTDRAGLVVFGQNPSVEVMPVCPSEFPNLEVFSSQVNQEATDIEKALKTSLSIFPPGFQKEIVLFSDGNETNGDFRKIIPLLVEKGVVVYTYGIGPLDIKDAYIKEFYCPPEVAENEPVRLRITLGATVDTRVELYLYQNAQLIRQFNELYIVKNQPLLLSLELPPLQQAVVIYEAHLVVPPTEPWKEICLKNNIAQAILKRRGKPSILYLTSLGAEKLVEKIFKANQDFQLDVKETPELVDLYDVIVIDDLPQNMLGDGGLTIKKLVQLGKGLLVLGGKHSFALGNYPGSSLEEVLPVWSSPKINLALAIVLDCSGSMAEPVTPEDNKFSLARKALTSAVKLLQKGDKLEVIVFNQEFQIVYEMKEIDGIINIPLEKVHPRGGTAILAPLRRALNDLKKTEASRKHIILISDGQSTTGETLEQAATVGEELQKAGITISTIATGVKVDEQFLKNLSNNESNGRFYPISDFREFTKLLYQDLSYYKELYVEKPNLKVKINPTGGPEDEPEELLRGIVSLPLLGGYNPTAMKERGKLLVAFEDNNLPLLAAWQYGLGRVVTFTSTLDDPVWSGDWLGWEKLAQFWTQVIRWLVPSRTAERSKDFVINTNIDNNQLVVSVQISTKQIRPQQQFFLELSPYTPSDVESKKILIEIPQIKPNKYEIKTNTLSRGIYYLVIYEGENKPANLIARTAVAIPYELEWRKFGPNLSNLSLIASATGGKLVNNLHEIKSLSTGSEVSYQDINWLIIILVLFFIIIDLFLDFLLGLRRIRLPT